MTLPKGAVYKALNESIDAAARDGRIDKERQAAIIAGARKVARVMDDPEWPNVGGRFDNVSPSSLLKYCDALGIVPPPAGKPKADGGAGAGAGSGQQPGGNGGNGTGN